MKKLALLFFMSLVVVSTLYSQIKFMPKAGVSYASVHLSDDLKSQGEDYKSKLGIIIGVAVEIPLVGEMLALQPELLFHQKGSISEYSSTGYTNKSTGTLNYLELPVLAKVKFGKFYAVAGPSFSYGLGGKYKDVMESGGQSQETTGKIKFGKEPENYNGDDSYVDNAVDVGVQIGAGVKIAVIVIELRYGLGLSNLMDKPDGYTGDYKSQNRSLQLTVGVPLGGNK